MYAHHKNLIGRYSLERFFLIFLITNDNFKNVYYFILLDLLNTFDFLHIKKYICLIQAFYKQKRHGNVFKVTIYNAKKELSVRKWIRRIKGCFVN